MRKDSIIIGAGPAGIMASLQMERAGLNVALFEKGKIGGLLRNAYRVENYMGFSDGISGENLIKHFEEHLRKRKIPLFHEEVVEIGKRDGVFFVHTPEHVYQSSTVVIATGTMPKKAGIEGEDALAGAGVFYEVAELSKDGERKDVIVIGGGDAAFDYALNLSERGYVPMILTRGTASCLPLLKKRALNNGIPCREHKHVTCLSKTGDRLTVQCGTECCETDTVLIAVGREPRYPRITAENRDGLYCAGDVHGGRYRQVHIALGDALRTAMEITHSLSSSAV